MRIGHFNTYPHGGAFIAAARFHEELLDQGLESNFYYRHALKPAPNHSSYQELNYSGPSRWQKLNPWHKETDYLRRRRIHDLFDLHLSARPVPGENFSMSEQTDPTRLNWAEMNLDLVHLHWIAHLADYPSFFQSIPRGTPIFWTLHDMFPLTGGCHYSAGCTRFESGCGNCPLVINGNPDDVSAESFVAKNKSLRSHRMHVIAPSQWLLSLAQSSPIWPEETEFSLVRYGIDLEQFKPHAKSYARSALALDAPGVLIGFGADNVADERKGMQDLLSALGRLPRELEVEVIAFGAGSLPTIPEGIKRVHKLGFVAEPDRQALIYSACDFVIVPSREDNQPSVGLESLACGTPVLGTRAGGIPEYVQDGITGLLADVGNPGQLAERISWLANHPEARQVMGQRGRMMMQREFEITRQAGIYRQMYTASLAASGIIRSRRAA